MKKCDVLHMPSQATSAQQIARIPIGLATLWYGMLTASVDGPEPVPMDWILQTVEAMLS
jgi:hypothetical protein